MLIFLIQNFMKRAIFSSQMFLYKCEGELENLCVKGSSLNVKHD